MAALRVNLDVSSWNIGTRSLAIGIAVFILLYSMYSNDQFNYDPIRPEALMLVMLSVICPTLFMGFYFQRLEICPAGKIITLIGLPIGIISGTFNIIPILTYIPETAPGFTGLSVAGAATGAMLTVLAHPWLNQSSSNQGKLGVSRLAVILVCIGALMLFMLFSDLAADSRHDFIGILNHWKEALFILSIISLLILLSPKRQRSYLHSVSVGCVISMGLGVAFATAYYFGCFRELGSESDLDRLGIPIGNAVIVSLYSCFIFITVIVLGLTQGKLNAGSFGTMNWHMTEIYVFFVFLMLAPPSIWEAIGKGIYDESALSNEALASRIQSLEERLQELD